MQEPPSFVQVFPLLPSLPLASWIEYVLLSGVNVFGGVVLGLVWCVLWWACLCDMWLFTCYWAAVPGVS